MPKTRPRHPRDLVCPVCQSPEGSPCVGKIGTPWPDIHHTERLLALSDPRSPKPETIATESGVNENLRPITPPTKPLRADKARPEAAHAPLQQPEPQEPLPARPPEAPAEPPLDHNPPEGVLEHPGARPLITLSPETSSQASSSKPKEDQPPLF